MNAFYVIVFVPEDGTDRIQLTDANLNVYRDLLLALKTATRMSAQLHATQKRNGLPVQGYYDARTIT